MLRKRWLALLVAAATVAALPLIPAEAVENGRPVNADEQWAGVLTVNGRFRCSVGIIDPEWALTAAHCTDTFSNADDAYVGGAAPVGSVQSVPQRIDWFAAAESGRDLALLHLQNPLQLDSYLKLPDNLPHPISCQTQCTADIYGWAQVGCAYEDRGCKFADIAQTAHVNFNPYLTTECVDVKGKDNSICSTATTRHGDSGGPLVFQKDGPRIIGVTSSSSRSGTTTSGNVTLELAWIKGMMEVGVIRIP